MKILISNDDGILAPGIQTLAHAAVEAGHEVYIAAPDGQRSAASHSITLDRPLTATRMEFPGIRGAWAIDGTPADCVRLALNHLCPEAEVVMTGINHGFNGGMDVLYSGTVASAMEGALMGRRAVAVSLAYEREDTYDLAAKLALEILERTAALELPDYSILNINYPMTSPALGVKAVPLRREKYEDHYVEIQLPDGRTGYRLEGCMAAIPDPIDDDYSWLVRGYATVTVLIHDMTDWKLTDRLGDLVEKPAGKKG